MGGIGSGRPAHVQRQLLAWRLRDEGLSFRRIGERMGITGEAAHQLLKRAGYVPKAPARVEPLSFIPAPRVFCEQCERNVLVAEAEQCTRAFCKAERKAA